jgi:hypothetical protein
MSRRNDIEIRDGFAGVFGKSRMSVEFAATSGGNVTAAGRDSGDSTSEKLFKMVEKEDDRQYVTVAGVNVSNWGTDNLFPNSLREVFNNNLAPGLLDFKTDMLFGAGFTLVNERTGEEEEFTQEWEWLNSWDVFTYLLQQITDFVTCENIFGQSRRSLSGKLITDLLHVNAQECRLEIMKNGASPRVVVGDYSDLGGKFTAYPRWNIFADVVKGEMKDKIAMYHLKKPTFGFRYYNYPVFIGAMNTWVPVANLIPAMHLNTLKNMLMAVYHVQIPLEALKQVAAERNWKEKDLKKFVEDKLAELDDMLSGAANAGKTFYSFTVGGGDGGKQCEWKITLIDSKLKEMSESYLKLFNDSNQALTSAFQVQPSLASIQLGDKMSSGSEVLNSYNLHVESRTPIARRLIATPINAALKINFKGTMAKLVFKNIPLVRQAKDKSGVGNVVNSE